MSEVPYFFGNTADRLFGVLHEPQHANTKTGFVFCHPLFEEKLWTHRVFVSFARTLAEHGYPVLRFDYRGDGDSEGDFEQYTISSRLEDIRTAISELRDRVGIHGHIGLLGLRLGATLAAMTAEQTERVGPLILWDPIINGADYMQEVLRANLTTQLAVYGKVTTNRNELVEMLRSGMTVNIEGYELSPELFFEASSIDLLKSRKQFSGHCLIVQIGRSQSAKLLHAELVDLYSHGVLRVANEEPFWREIRRFYGRADDLGRVTLDWLESRHG